MDGIVLVNKKEGYTSRDIVNIISKKLNTKKVGHTGTLDPIASGVLIVCVGKATKLVKLLTSEDKEYIATITLGILTDTLDIEGKIISEENVHIDKKDIIDALDKIKGKYIQEVPIYSAIKVNGKKLYEYAREGKEIKLPKREVNIYDISLLEDPIYKDNKTIIKIKCKVSKGTYIRSLSYDIARMLNTVGIMSSLTRTRQGKYGIDICYNLDEINDNNFVLLPIDYFLKDYYEVDMDDNLYKKIKNGVAINNIYNKDFVKFKYNNDIVALYKNDNNILKCYIMLNN